MMSLHNDQYERSTLPVGQQRIAVMPKASKSGSALVFNPSWRNTLLWDDELQRPRFIVQVSGRPDCLEHK
jgi:hypothetical protein